MKNADFDEFIRTASKLQVRLLLDSIVEIGDTDFDELTEILKSLVG